MMKSNIEASVMKIESHDDEYWINRIPSDSSAFEVIYDRYLPKISRYIHRKVGDQMVTEDLTSQVFFNALDGILSGRYVSRNKFAAWIFSIARTKIADYYREKQTVSLEDLHQEIGSDDHRGFEFEGNEALANCFSDLSQKEQDLLALRFSAELDFFTIALILHKNSAAIKMATYRALRNLRKKMEGYHDQE